MKIIKIMLGMVMISSLALFTGCASDSSSAGAGSGNEAGAGTSGSSQAVGGPGHGPEGAMNGTSQ